MAKKKNSRKALAVALGIMGVAGLSVASASQLTVNTNSDNIAVGVGAFAAACDSSVEVDFAYNTALTEYTDVTISDIDANCQDGEVLTYTISGTNANLSPYTKTGTIAANLTGSESISLAGVPLTTALDTIDIAIY